MESPDRDYVFPVSGQAQIRTELGITSGEVDWFVVQLEYNERPSPLEDDDWQPVARFDHHPQMAWGHDIREEGLHCDMYQNGIKVKTKFFYSDIPVNDAPDWAEDHLVRFAGYYLGHYHKSPETSGAQVSE